MTDTQTDDMRTEAEKIGRSYNHALEEIRRNPDLTDESRQRRMAEAYLAAKTRMANLREGDKAERAKEIKSLQEDLLDPRRSPVVSITADKVTVATSFRDALARAAATEGTSDLITVMDRATSVGDDLQARACLTIALERHDLHAINRYADSHPGTEPKLQRLIDLGGGIGNSRGISNLERTFQTGAVIVAPPELHNMKDYELEKLVRSG